MYRVCVCVSAFFSPPVRHRSALYGEKINISIVYHSKMYISKTYEPMYAAPVLCSGGLEALFGNQKELEMEMDVPPNGDLNVGAAMVWARDNLLQERPELFMQGDTM